jgi:hypothetical protein
MSLWTFDASACRLDAMTGTSERPHVRTSGALWFGAPLVLAACVAAEAAPQTCDTPDRAPDQIRLGRLVRDGVARLAESTHQTLGPTHVTFVLFVFDHLAGPAVAPMEQAGCLEFLRPLSVALRARPLDPGHASSPTAAP